MKIRTLSWIGIFVYLSSYFLPAIGNLDHDPMHVIRGWACAFFSIWFGLGAMFSGDLTPEGHKFFISLLLPGLTNPLLLLYVVLASTGQWVRSRKVIVLLIFVCAATTPIAFHLMPLLPLIGAYLWIAGLAMTIFPELLLMSSELSRAIRENRNNQPA